MCEKGLRMLDLSTKVLKESGKICFKNNSKQIGFSVQLAKKILASIDEDRQGFIPIEKGKCLVLTSFGFNFFYDGEDKLISVRREKIEILREIILEAT